MKRETDNLQAQLNQAQEQLPANGELFRSHKPNNQKNFRSSPCKTK